MIESINEQERKLFEKWKGSKLNWVKDGVVCERNYRNADPKVLYILKEANGGKEKKWINGDLRIFLEEAKKWQTWNNIARWQYGIKNMNGEISWWDCLNRINQSFRQRHLKDIAVLNIKKEPGSGSSNMKEVWNYAIKDQGLLKEQIKIYNPDIVICGGTGEIVKKMGLVGNCDNWEFSKKGIGYLKIDNRCVIDYVHPASRKSGKKLFWDLINTLREVK